MSVVYDDSIIQDTEAEKTRDMQEVSVGLMQPWEYRVRWYGEDEATARRNVVDASARNGLQVREAGAKGRSGR